MCSTERGRVWGQENVWEVKKFVTSARKRGMYEFTVRLGAKQRGEKMRERREKRRD